MINLSWFWDSVFSTCRHDDFCHVCKDTALRCFADVKSAAREEDEDGEDEAGGWNGEAKSPTDVGLDIYDDG